MATTTQIHNTNSNSPASTSNFLECGYKVYSPDEIPTKFKCIYCKLIIKEPVQLTECGHRACRGCFESRAAISTDVMVCPVSDCNETFDKSEFMNDRAFKKELIVLPVTCTYKDERKCPWVGALNVYQEHLDKEHIYHICHQCEETFSSSQLLNDHIEKSCTKIFESCPFGAVCTTEMIRRDEFSAHLLSEKHQEAMASVLTGKHYIPETTDQDQNMETNSANNQLEEEVSDKLSDLADRVQKLNDDTVKLSRDFVKLSELCQVAAQEVNHFRITTNERNIIMTSLQPKQETIQKDIETIKQNFEDNQHVSTDGTLTWRVDRVAERMADAQSDRQPSIFSPIFFSGPTGYKMRARLYLHGDGNARRTHMSLFFLLMQGDYDALLSWPFGYKVTFCLFDQTGNNRHIIDSFRPDVKSSSFQRPKTESNIASGIPKFFPLPMIQQDDNPYVREDTMFLKIVVDLNDTPKMILPYMLTLNPGLPNHVQQILINQEKIKRQQQQTAANATPAAIPMNTCG